MPCLVNMKCIHPYPILLKPRLERSCDFSCFCGSHRVVQFAKRLDFEPWYISMCPHYGDIVAQYVDAAYKHSIVWKIVRCSNCSMASQVNRLFFSLLLRDFNIWPKNIVQFEILTSTTESSRLSCWKPISQAYRKWLTDPCLRIVHSFHAVITDLSCAGRKRGAANAETGTNHEIGRADKI